MFRNRPPTRRRARFVTALGAVAILSLCASCSAQLPTDALAAAR